MKQMLLVAVLVVLAGCKPKEPPVEGSRDAAAAADAAPPRATVEPLATGTRDTSCGPVDPSAASDFEAGTPPPSVVRCTACAAGNTIRVEFDVAKKPTMGTVSIESVSTGTRRFVVHAERVPEEAIYSLTFDRYGPGDRKPPSERLIKGKSVVAHLFLGWETRVTFRDVELLSPRVDGGEATSIRDTIVCADRTPRDASSSDR